MKRSGGLAFGLFAALVLAFPSLSPSAQAQEVAQVGVAYDAGGLGDHSFNDATALGLSDAQQRLHIPVISTVTDGSESDREFRLNTLISKNCNLIIAVGGDYATAVKSVALTNPKIQFVIINDASISMSNVSSLVFSDSQAGYLAGMTAALASKSGKIGLVGSAGQGAGYKRGFSAGAHSVRSDITVDARFGSHPSSDLADSLIRDGSDVIFLTTLGSGTDVVNTVWNANKSGAHVGLILLEPDQYMTLPAAAKKYVLASIVKRVDRAVVNVISSVQAGHMLANVLDPAKGIYGRRFGIKTGGIEISLWSPLVSRYRKVINLGAVRAEQLPL